MSSTSAHYDRRTADAVGKKIASETCAYCNLRISYEPFVAVGRGRNKRWAHERCARLAKKGGK